MNQPSAAPAMLQHPGWLKSGTIAHGMTRRVAGMGKADGNVGLGSPRDRDDAWAMRQAWCASAGIDPTRLVTLGQVHGSGVIRVGRADAGRGATPDSEQIGFGDALITDEPGVALMTLHADCLPILLWDPIRSAIGAVHAGWRGTVAGIAAATVRDMQSAFGCRPADMHAFLGPANGPCCYEVGQDVVDAWHDAGGERLAIDVRGGKTYFDVPGANLSQLMLAGLEASHIYLPDICTQCSSDDWFSHRAQGAFTGRFGAIIMLREADGGKS